MPNITGPTNVPWISYSPTVTGFSAVPASAVYRYRKMGTTVQVYGAQPNNGTSNANSFTISLPFPAATITGMKWNNMFGQPVNNGTINTTTPGIVETLSGESIITVYQNLAGTAWTTSGGKRAPSFQLTYESAV